MHVGQTASKFACKKHLIRVSIEKGKLFGTMKWVEKIVEKFNPVSITRKGGRPKNGT